MCKSETTENMESIDDLTVKDERINRICEAKITDCSKSLADMAVYPRIREHGIDAKGDYNVLRVNKDGQVLSYQVDHWGIWAIDDTSWVIIKGIVYCSTSKVVAGKQLEYILNSAPDANLEVRRFEEGN